MNINQFLPLTETTYYIMLSLIKPQHGYGIMQQVKQLSNDKVVLAPGTLYGALSNLKKQKLIKPFNEDTQNRRKVYKLTDLGLDVLSMEFQRMQTLISISKTLLEKETNQ